MEKTVQEYLDSINSTQTIIDRVYYLKQYGENFYGLTFPSIFLSTDNEDNQLQYKSLFLFSSEYIVEFKDFLNKIDVDLTKITSKIEYFEMFDSIDKEQKLKIHISLAFNMSCTFFAQGANCSYLQLLAKKYMIPNMK